MSSLESAVSILHCFSAERSELAVTDVAARLGMPKSTVSRLLLAMAGHGLVEQDAVTRRYRVGLLPFRLGQLYYAHVRVVELVEAAVESMVGETGFTGYIGVLNGADIVILRKRLGRYPVQMVLDAGTHLAAATTAFGKALLARMHDDALRALLTDPLVDPRTGSSRPLADLFGELDQIRHRHWAIAEAVFPGVCAIGAAVGSADEQQAIGFSLSFPSAAVDQAGRDDIARRVVDAARGVAVTAADPLWQAPRAVPRPVLRPGPRPGPQAAPEAKRSNEARTQARAARA